MKAPLSLLIASRYTWQERRCCDDRPPFSTTRGPAWPTRWSRKLRVALPTSFGVFRRQVARPATPPAADPGTPVVSSSGRPLGTVRGVVVELDTGRSSYAVTPEKHDAGRVLLLPLDAVDDREDAVVIEEHVLRRLERRIA